VRCGGCRNHHCRSNFVGMQRSFEWPTDQVFRRPFLFLCYIRLITTRRFQQSHCHYSWRSRRLSFAMVGEFRVGDVVCQKNEWNN
jgi:hypothetical protein